MEKIIPSLSKIWIKVINLEQSLFPKLQSSMGVLTPKEEKLIKILDFAERESKISRVFGEFSQQQAGRSYKTGNDKPWALLIPSSFPHPVEQTNIADAYHNYLDWVASEGQTHADWYIYNKTNNLKQSYSDESKIIIHP